MSIGLVVLVDHGDGGFVVIVEIGRTEGSRAQGGEIGVPQDVQTSAVLLYVYLFYFLVCVDIFLFIA